MKKIGVAIAYIIGGMPILASNMIKIDYLKNHPDQIETCGTWAFKTWGHYTPDKNLKDYIESRKEYLNENFLPFTLIAFNDAKPIGMCSLAKTRGILPGLTPWLAALYVELAFRGQGVGTLLEKDICQKARDMGYQKIYCFTSDKTVIPWYVKHGWQYRELSWIHDHEITVLEKDLLRY